MLELWAEFWEIYVFHLLEIQQQQSTVTVSNTVFRTRHHETRLLKSGCPVSYEYGSNKIKQAAQFLISTLRNSHHYMLNFAKLKHLFFSVNWTLKQKLSRPSSENSFDV